MPLLCAATLIDTSKIPPIVKFYCIFWLYIENQWLLEVVRYHWRSPSPASTGQIKITQSRLFRAEYTWDSVRIFEDRDTTISLCNLFQCFTTLKIILDFLLLFDGISCTSICVCWTTFEKSGSSSVLFIHISKLPPCLFQAEQSQISQSLLICQEFWEMVLHLRSLRSVYSVSIQL